MRKYYGVPRNSADVKILQECLEVCFFSFVKQAGPVAQQAQDAARRRTAFNPLHFGAMAKLRAALEAEVKASEAKAERLWALRASALWLADFWMF